MAITYNTPSTTTAIAVNSERIGSRADAVAELINGNISQVQIYWPHAHTTRNTAELYSNKAKIWNITEMRTPITNIKRKTSILLLSILASCTPYRDQVLNKQYTILVLDEEAHALVGASISTPTQQYYTDFTGQAQVEPVAEQHTVEYVGYRPYQLRPTGYSTVVLQPIQSPSTLTTNQED